MNLIERLMPGAFDTPEEIWTEGQLQRCRLLECCGWDTDKARLIWRAYAHEQFVRWLVANKQLGRERRAMERTGR